MSQAELKLELIQEINQLKWDQLLRLQAYLHSMEKEGNNFPYERRFGALKGTLLYMAPDFDAPLEDFNEYM